MGSFGVKPEKEVALRERMANLGIAESDLDERFVTSGGAGGQHVNKTATCVYLSHRPTGQEVKMQEARSQALNRYYARKRLCELIEAEQLGDESPEAKRAAKLRKQKQRRRRRTRKKLAEPQDE